MNIKDLICLMYMDVGYVKPHHKPDRILALIRASNQLGCMMYSGPGTFCIDIQFTELLSHSSTRLSYILYIYNTKSLYMKMSSLLYD